MADGLKFHGGLILALVVLVGTSSHCISTSARRDGSAASPLMFGRWDAVRALEAGESVRVVIDRGVLVGGSVPLDGDFITASADTLVVEVDPDEVQFEEPAAGAPPVVSVVDPDEWTGGELMRFEARAVIREGDSSRITVDKEAVRAVFRPSIWRWLGPLRDCGWLGAIGGGVGAVAGLLVGDPLRGAMIGGGSGCAVGVLFWYGDRSDTGGLESEAVYRRRSS